MAIPYRIGTTITDEIERVYDDVTKCASQVAHSHGAHTVDIEDWLTAEKELLWKPRVEILERQSLFIVRIALDLVEPSAVDILVTADDVLVQSNADSQHLRIFRVVHFPVPINPSRLQTTYVKPKLILIAPKLFIEKAFAPVAPGMAVRL